MSNLLVIGLLNNAALLLALGVVFGTLLPRSDSWSWRLTRGFILGVIAIGVMANPWELAPGIFFDTRTILLSVGGMFLGFIPTTIAILIAGLYRFYLGGAGTFTGISWIVTSGLLGVVWVKWRRCPGYQISSWCVYCFGLVVQLIMLLLMFTMPNAMAMPILNSISLPVLLIFPVATVLLAKLLAGQEIQFYNRKELDRSERQYRELVQHSRVILLRIDTRGSLTFINEYGENLFGYRKDELLGKNIFGTIVPKTDLTGHDLEANIKQLLEHPDRYLDQENENICKDGCRLQVAWKNTALRDSSGRTIGVQCLGQDVTERRRAENILKAKDDQFQRLVDVTPIPLVIVGQDQNIVYSNQKFRELFGYTREDLASFEDWWLLAYPDEEYREQVKRRWNFGVTRSIDEQAVFEPQEARVTCKDGTVRDIVALFSSVGEQGIVVLNDVSRERELSRMKSEFIATTAHELRTPLTAVRGFTELLLHENDFDEAEKHEYLTIAYEKTEVLEQIIDDLQDLSRVESGRMIHLEIQPCSIRDLVFSAVDSYRMEFPEHHFELTWPEQQPGKTLADPQKIAQVLDNLLSNAVKFSPPESTVSISGSAIYGELRITVQDEGSGMEQEQVGQVFDKFYRADSSDTAPAGLGLGLAIAKGIIQAHGSAIWVESKPGKGTRVSFTLPLR